MLSPFLARVMPDMEFFALFAGLVGLWLGTEATIRGAVGITLRLRVSEFINGYIGHPACQDSEHGAIVYRCCHHRVRKQPARGFRLTRCRAQTARSIVLAFFRRARGIQRLEAAVILGLYIGYVAIKTASL